MAARQMVGCRIPAEWKEKLEAIGESTGRNTAQVVYEAIQRFLHNAEETETYRQIRLLLQQPDTLESNPVIASLSSQMQALEAKFVAMEKLLSTSSGTLVSHDNKGKVPLTAEQLAFILKVTPRAVNQAAARGEEHFMQWSQKHSKTGKWTFEVINPGAKKCDRRFFSVG